jgi:menaquinone-9 beta-reductase
MRSAEVIVVGGGPAGSAAAQRLKAAGADVIVLDKAQFPRTKLCAGWITPQVLTDLQLDPEDYPHGFLSFRRLHFHSFGLGLAVPCVQHSIRRFEFDAWLLQRSGAELVQHTVREIRADGGGYLIDGAFRCRYLIGAAGTSCPVRRALFSQGLPRMRALQTATLELEFPCDWQDPDCHLWFFEHGLPGYSWYVPKAAGWLNVGVGGMAATLTRRGENIRVHWDHLVAKLRRKFGLRVPGEETGYSYYVRGPLEPALLLDAADRQHQAAQADLAGHGGVAAHGAVGHQRHQRHEHGDAGARPSLGMAPAGTWTWMSLFSKRRADRCRARGRFLTR